MGPPAHECHLGWLDWWVVGLNQRHSPARLVHDESLLRGVSGVAGACQRGGDHENDYQSANGGRCAHVALQSGPEEPGPPPFWARTGLPEVLNS